MDNYREMWPYRDWVIGAFNSNMRFDGFVVDQIAGDLMENRTLEQQIASGFHRCGISTNEAGVIVDEVEAIYAKDRVDTTGTVFLGLTLGCATCHDHKFDPLSQRDFYSMAAFFRNTTQNTMDDNVPDTPPMVVVPRVEERARWIALNQEAAMAQGRKKVLRGAETKGFQEWLGSKARRNVMTPLEAAAEVFSLWRTSPIVVATGVAANPSRKAIHFDKGGSPTLPNQSVFEADKPFNFCSNSSISLRS